MTLLNLIITIFFLTLFSIGCNENKFNTTPIEQNAISEIINQDSLNQKLNNAIKFFGDSLLKEKYSLIKNYVTKYQNDSCVINVDTDKVLKSEFEGIKVAGDINKNGILDTVFVIPSFNYCDNGDSYSFYDTTLPRLSTDSYCCHPDNLFSIGDIDEDGTDEICIFYSSCASRFKSLIAYTLKDNNWKQVGRSLFDIGIMKPIKEKRVRKISKGKFEILSIEDVLRNGKTFADKRWEQFTF